MRTKITTMRYERETGRKPRGFGNWLLAKSRTEIAFDADLENDVPWMKIEGTISQVRKIMANRCTSGYWAILS